MVGETNDLAFGDNWIRINFRTKLRNRKTKLAKLSLGQNWDSMGPDRPTLVGPIQDYPFAWYNAEGWIG